ncbi:MAG: hypothetical protein ACRDQA_32005, partial [Nocardioidaceae bacterium]
MSVQSDTAVRPANGGAPDDQEQAGGQPFWVTVMTREMLVKLTDRNFILSTGLTLLIMVGLFAFQGFISARDTTVHVAVSGSGTQAVAEHAHSLAGDQDVSLDLDVRRYDSAAAVNHAVSSGDVDAGLVNGADGWRLVGKTDKDTNLETYVRQAVQDRTLQRNATDAGTTAQALTRGSDVPYHLLTPDSHT